MTKNEIDFIREIILSKGLCETPTLHVHNISCTPTECPIFSYYCAIESAYKKALSKGVYIMIEDMLK
jgi:hypothetical protein